MRCHKGIALSLAFLSLSPTFANADAPSEKTKEEKLEAIYDEFFQQQGRSNTVKRDQGYVPDAKTAVAVAEAILVPIYGEKVLGQRPFIARLKKDEWRVHGSLPEGTLGGTAVIFIKKKNGAVTYINHTK